MRQEVEADGRVPGMGAAMTPRLSYLICATPRSGSTLLERLLEEAFRKGTTENGVLGTKIMWAYFRDFVRLARRTPGLRDVRPCEVPASVLPNLRRHVWIHRRDTTRQAVSLAGAAFQLRSCGPPEAAHRRAQRSLAELLRGVRR